MDYYYPWPPGYTDQSHPRTQRWHSSTPPRYFTPTRHYPNEGTPVSLDTYPSQRFRCRKSRSIRRNLFPTSYNCYSQDVKHRNPAVPFTNYKWTRDSRPYNFTIHHDTPTQDGRETARYSDQMKSVQMGPDICTAPFWPTGELMDSYNDIYRTSCPTIQRFNGTENNYVDSSCQNRQDFFMSADDPEHSQIRAKFDYNYGLDADMISDHRNYSSVASTSVPSTNSTNTCAKKNPEVVSMHNDTQDLRCSNGDILESVMRATIWTSSEIEPSVAERQCLQQKDISCNDINQQSEGDKTSITDCDTKVCSSEALDATVEYPFYYTEQSIGIGTAHNAYEKISNETCSPLQPKSNTFTAEYEIINCSGSDENKSDKNKLLMTDQSYSNSDTQQIQLVYEPISEILNILESETLFPEFTISGSETIFECSSADLKQLPVISGVECNITKEDKRAGVWEHEMEEKMKDNVGTVAEFLVDTAASKSVEMETSYSLNILEYDAINDGDLSANKQDIFCFNSVSDEIEKAVRSIKNYRLEEPDKFPMLSILESEDLDNLLSTCVAPNSVLKQKPVKKRISSVFKTAKIKAKRKRSQDTIAQKYLAKNHKTESRRLEYKRPTNFKIHRDAETQVSEWDSNEISRCVDKRDVASQWEDTNSVDSTELGSSEKTEENGENQEDLLLFTCQLKVTNKDETFNEETASGFSLKRVASTSEIKKVREEHVPIRINTPLIDGLDKKFGTPIIPILRSEETESKSCPTSMLKNSSHEANLKKSDHTRKCCTICSDLLQHCESFSKENENIAEMYIDTTQKSDYMNRCNKQVINDPNVCDTSQSNSVSKEVALNSKLILLPTQSEDELNEMEASNILIPKFTHSSSYQKRRSTIKAKDSNVNSELSTDPTREVNNISYHSDVCQDRGCAPNERLTIMPSSKSTSRRHKQKQFNPIAARSGAIVIDELIVDSSKYAEENEKLEKTLHVENKATKRERSRRSGGVTKLVSRASMKHHLRRKREGKNHTNRITECTLPVTTRVLRKRRGGSLQDPSPKQLKQ